MKTKKSIVFVTELCLLFVILVMVIVVIAQVMVKNRQVSLRARHLTEAVIVAQNICELSSGAGDNADAAALISAMDQVVSSDLSGDTITARVRFAMEDGPEDMFTVRLVRTLTPDENGTLIQDLAEVSFGDETEILYTLESGTYTKELME